jgi:hypothetical protein
MARDFLTMPGQRVDSSLSRRAAAISARLFGSRLIFSDHVRLVRHSIESSGVANAILADGFVSQFRERPGGARPPLKLNRHYGRLLSTSAGREIDHS